MIKKHYAKDHEKEKPEGYWEFRKSLELFEPSQMPEY
jgi:hypothetical protein